MKTLAEYINEVERLEGVIAEATLARNGLALEAAELAPVKVGDVIPVHREAYSYEGKSCRVDSVRLGVDHYTRPVWKIRATVLKADGSPTRAARASWTIPTSSHK